MCNFNHTYKVHAVSFFISAAVLKELPHYFVDFAERALTIPGHIKLTAESIHLAEKILGDTIPAS